MLKPYDARVMRTSFELRRRLEALDGKSLAQHQLSRLNALLEHKRIIDHMSGGIVMLPNKFRGSYLLSIYI